MQKQNNPASVTPIILRNADKELAESLFNIAKSRGAEIVIRSVGALIIQWQGYFGTVWTAVDALKPFIDELVMSRPTGRPCSGSA